MEAQQARFLLNYLMAQIEDEFGTTKKVLAAIPEDKKDYRPHPVAKTALELAWHTVLSDLWFIQGVARGEFAMEQPTLPAEIASVADLVSHYDSQMGPLISAAKAFTDEQLLKPISFFGVMNQPAVTYLSFLLMHTIHHRGQISTYLRAMGAKVPSIYGGSADEPFQPPA
jgi:uncharacterized damage-inducible protein DinB